MLEPATTTRIQVWTPGSGLWTLSYDYSRSSVIAPLSRLLDSFGADLVPEFPGRLVVPPQLRAVSLAGIAQHLGRPLFAVLASERDAEDLAEDVALFTDRVLLLPAWETLPFEHISPNVATMAQRARARNSLREADAGMVVVGSVRAATQRVSPSPVEPLTFSVGDEVDFDGLVEWLAVAGYHRTDRVEARGEFAVRGGLVDVFPADSNGPVRAEFWGDEVDEMTPEPQDSISCARGNWWTARGAFPVF